MHYIQGQLDHIYRRVCRAECIGMNGCTCSITTTTLTVQQKKAMQQHFYDEAQLLCSCYICYIFSSNDSLHFLANDIGYSIFVSRIIEASLSIVCMKIVISTCKLKCSKKHCTVRYLGPFCAHCFVLCFKLYSSAVSFVQYRSVVVI